MKKLVFTICILLQIQLSAQEQSIEQFVEDISSALINLEDFRKFSQFEIPRTTTINFFLTDKIKDVEVTDSTISMTIDPGRGEFCTYVVFKYYQHEGKYYLQFQQPHQGKVLYTEKAFIDPWYKRENLCESK